MAQILSPALISELNLLTSKAPGVGFGEALESVLQGMGAQLMALAIVDGVQTVLASTDPGTPGTICWDADYLYICTGATEWKRLTLDATPW